MNKPTILAGTSKGLIQIEKQKSNWEITKVHFKGLPVSCIYVDTRNNKWWAGVNHRHWGQKLYYSDNQGTDWQIKPVPAYPKEAKLSNGKAASLKKIWCLASAGADKTGAMWMGTEPGGLFYSKENGAPFELVTSLWDHPSRSNENQWFGAGRDHPFIHSIVVDPTDSDHVYVAVSCAGVFETKDGGKSWSPKNKGLVAAYLPKPNVEIGHDPHLLLQCKYHPTVLWQQNHCGIFRSTDGGNQWTDVSDKNGIANYGFALAIDNDNPEKAWVIPALSDLERIPPDLALTVCQTTDGGQSWQILNNGLPQDFCFDIVFRHSFAKHNNVLTFGTTNGNIYLSENEGKDWSCISYQLARVESIIFSV